MSHDGPTYLEPTNESGRAFFQRGITGEVVMLNLLRFREVADYSGAPALAPNEPISGAEAFRRYIDHTMPYLTQSGGIGDDRCHSERSEESRSSR